MKLSPYDIELIEKKIDGSLDEKELEDFRKREQDSEEFRQAVLFQSKLLATLEAQEKSRIKQQLIKEFQEPVEKRERDLASTNRFWYGIAAGVILVASSIFVFRNVSMEQDSLFDEFYEPYPNILKARSLAYDSIGLGLYSSGKYEEAIENMKLHVPTSDTIHFYLGMCYMSIDNHNQAVLYLNKIHTPSIFIQQRNWYKGLAQLELGQVDSAIVLFDNIKESEFRFEESQLLLNTIR